MKHIRTKYLRRLPAATLLSFGIITTAHAKVARIFSSGYWSVYEGTNTENELVCEINTQAANNSWFFSIDFFPHSSVLQVVIIKNTWEIPAKTKIPIVLKIDRSGFYSAIASGREHKIYWFIPKHLVGEFAVRFAESNEMQIIFERGDEPPWQLSLNGSSAALAQFIVCMKAINAAQSGSGPSQPTQPYNSAPTQPFASPAPQPSEPRPKPNIPRNNNTLPAGNSPSYQHV